MDVLASVIAGNEFAEGAVGADVLVAPESSGGNSVAAAFHLCVSCVTCGNENDVVALSLNAPDGPSSEQSYTYSDRQQRTSHHSLPFCAVRLFGETQCADCIQGRCAKQRMICGAAGMSETDGFLTCGEAASTLDYEVKI